MAYYLPINSTSLAHYFVCACIKPAKYFKNKLQDIQDNFPNVLLLSSEIGTKDTDCCIELVLTEDEEKKITSYEKKFYLFPAPLPISRVKTIYFRNENQMKQTLSNINMSAAFIPDRLVKVERFSDSELNLAHPDAKLGCTDYSHQLTMFDRFLGALALMKIAREPYMNFSENYASTLSFFNAQIRADLDRQHRQVNEKFFGLFSRSDSFQKFLPYLEKTITNDDLDQIAAENGQRIERSYTKAINCDKLSGNTYAFAILKSYGVGEEAATQKIDSLIVMNFKKLKEGTAEGIALYYGYNRGYSVFSNSYGTQETGKQIVKYLLDSQLDYYTIESVYQFAFNDKTTSSQFPYIDAWCPKKSENPKRKTDYIVLDTVFIGKKKPSVISEDYLRGYLVEKIKTFNFITTPIASLVELIRDIVADDTRDEVEDDQNAKVADIEKNWRAELREKETLVDSLKEKITELQKQIKKLNSEIERLKSTAGVLQEPEVKHGQESPKRDPGNLPIGDSPIASGVDGYTIGEKEEKRKKATKTKAYSSISKSSSKTSKKRIDKGQRQDANKVAIEPRTLAKEDVFKSSSVRVDGELPFESNE